jgi:hypothetical protein
MRVKLASKLPIANPLSLSTRLLEARGFGVTPVPPKGILARARVKHRPIRSARKYPIVKGLDT